MINAVKERIKKTGDCFHLRQSLYISLKLGVALLAICVVTGKFYRLLQLSS